MRHRFALLGLTTLFGGLAFVSTINDFLAISRPVDANILVVEGWIWNSPALREASVEFKRGHYTWLVTVGGPSGGNGETLAQDNTAELAARQLRELGVDENLIVVLRVPDMTRHRSYASALTLSNWLARSHTQTIAVNVFTVGAHARKSFVLFKRALGSSAKVGVIAGTEDGFNPNRWWMSPRGIYVIVRKTLGYLYAVFWPLPESLPASS